jgi:hypothetical protein
LLGVSLEDLRAVDLAVVYDEEDGTADVRH